MNEKIMLIDGNSIISRAFYGVPLLSNQKGVYTNAVYGFISMFRKLYVSENPDRVLVAFDLPKPTFRHLKFSDYKGNRKPMPEELRPQIPMLKNLLRLMNLEVFELEGFEADDILGSFAVYAEKAGLDVVLVSGDRDLLQIATDKVKIVIPKTKGGKTEVESYYSADVLSAYGVSPQEFIDMKALMGDASDNIPGVAGIGEKTAQKIIQQFKSVENAIANADSITPKKASENLKNNPDIALLSKELATIFTNVPIKDLPEKQTNADIFNSTAFEEVKRLEFRTLFTLFEQQGAKLEHKQSSDLNVIEIINLIDLKDLIIRLQGCEISAFSCIHSGGMVYGFAICFEEDKSYFVNCLGNEKDEFIDLLKSIFEGPTKKVFHDLKTETTILNSLGITLSSAVFDTMLAYYVIDSSRSNFDIKEIAYTILGKEIQNADEFFEKGKRETFENGKLSIFGGNYANAVFRSCLPLKKQLEENNQNQLYFDIEFPLVNVLHTMEKEGILVDKKGLEEFGMQLDRQISALTGEIHFMAGEEFNISSPKQLGVILFEKLGLKASKKTKTGYSTNNEVLQELLSKHEIVERIIEYRTYTKLKSTYVDGLLAVIKSDGRIHSTFNQIITATGRISSTEPNLQNIPIRYALGRELRKIFIPKEGFVFVDADYSQIELRILAHLSQDETIIGAFKDGIDIHRLTASQVFNVPEDMVTKEMRSNAKAVNFGIVYGMSAFSLANDIDVPVREAQRYIDGYFAKYPKVKSYLDNSIAEARDSGFSKTIFGRRRKVDELRSSNFNIRSFGERVAMNTPIQGSAADIIKIAMVRIYEKLETLGLRSKLLLQVHDELLLEVHNSELEQVKILLKTEMENAAKLLVPMEVECLQGENWLEAH